MRRALLMVLSLSAACQLTPPKSASAPRSPVPLPAVVAGANLRPVGDPRHGYGTRTARRTMERLASMGVNTLGVLLEGRMATRGDPAIRAPDADALEAARGALADANALGLATVLIPHLVLEDGDWRGYVVLEDPAQREAWWTAYARFLDVAAGVAATSGATVLSIGVEVKGLSKTEDTRRRMSALAARVRRDYHGLLTYGANWDEAEEVRFWDAVDLAGVNGYYPLEPDPERGAEAVARRLDALARRSGKEVLLLEVGYRSSPLPHLRPWEWPDAVPGVVDDAGQARAWAAVLAHWLPARGGRGLLAWVVPTDPEDPRAEPRHGFSPLGKAAEQVIARAFRALAPQRANDAPGDGAHPAIHPGRTDVAHRGAPQ